VPATVVETNSDDDVRSPASPASPAPEPVPASEPVPTATGGSRTEPEPPLPRVGVIVGCCPLCVEAAPIEPRRPPRDRDDLAGALRITVSR